LSGHAPDKDQELFCFWATLLDEQEKKHIRLSGLKSGALYVNVDSSVWLYQMKLKKPQFLGRIQEKFPDIQNIYIKIGPIL